MKKVYVEPEVEVRNYTQLQDGILTTSTGEGDLNGGDDIISPKGIL